jgi:SAM-dependent methyltransferase
MLLPFDMERPAPVRAAIDSLATQGNLEERGAVFTKSEVVEGILDLCNYIEESDLTSMRLLEPSAGDGEFLLAAVARLLRSCKALHGQPSQHLNDLRPCIRAIELHRPTFNATFSKLVSLLVDEGLTQQQAKALAEEWFRQDDFLLATLEGTFDVAVGNPPYVRQERIPNALLAEYKRTFSTLYDRADLYVLFYERCLDLLRPKGVLGFICANRWVKNKYGGPLREKVARGYNLDVYIDLSHADAFHEQVDAYPAITVIRREPQSSTRVLTHGRNGEVPVGHLFQALREPQAASPVSVSVSVVHDVGCGRDPWLVDAPEILGTIRNLEHAFPTLEEAGAKVGIGVATGADKIYIGAHDSLPVEAERRLPLVMSGDLRPTGIEWSGRGLVNPWQHDGTLASLEDYPRFGEYLRKHAPALKARHTAKKSPDSWYKTIDRVYPALAGTPKLLIPDIKGEATVVFDEGRYYPHHNLYVVTSDTWDLRALQAVLRSSVALAFVAAYCVRMSGGFLRFQAQYLRRIRVPSWETMAPKVREELAGVCVSTDQAEVDEAVYAAYGLPSNQARMISKFSASARVATEKK